MTLDTLIMLAGTFVAVLPFLGFPSSWDTVLLLLAGIFIISLGVTLRRRSTVRNPERKSSGMSMDNGPLQRGDHETL